MSVPCCLFVFRCVWVQVMSVLPSVSVIWFQMPVECDVVDVFREDVSDVVGARYLYDVHSLVCHFLMYP